jgi:agmatine deiminase
MEKGSGNRALFLYSRGMRHHNRRAFLTASVGLTLPLASRRAASQDAQLASYHMPMETTPHLRTFMQWPVSVDVYGERLLKRVQTSIARIAQAIAQFEEVVMLVGNEHIAHAQSLLGKSVQIWDIPTDDLWCRDSGPTFVRNAKGDFAISHIKFNGWGNKQPHVNDGKIAERVAKKLGLPLLQTSLFGEQGGLEHDGAGLVLAHASCWVNANRNSGTADEIGQKLLLSVGGQKMIWAPGMKGADITDYHIDALARFVSPGKVLIQLPTEIDPDDPWSKSAFETLAILKAATTLQGKPLDIVTIPEPVNTRSKNKEFVAGYVNYYICNGAIICSEFGDFKADGEAKDILQQLYPGREVVFLNTDPLGESGGGIHCATQQQPLAGA